MPEQTTLPEASEVIEPVLDRREMLAEALERAEPIQQEERSAEQRARDEAGRFAPKQEAKPQEAAPVVDQQPAEPAKPRLTTWKKEYLPLADKLAQGIPLTPEEARKLDAYNVQRESEYSTGISVFKDRATRLESLEKAITPFMPALQKHNIAPDKWIAQLGSAHEVMALGTDEQKLQMFIKLAGDYKVPLARLAEQNGQPAQGAAVYDEINAMRSQLEAMNAWREQLQQREITSILSKFEDAEKYPHFEKVRVPMAQLLESGFARDPDEAYTKAVRLDDEAWKAEEQRQSQAAQAQNTARQVVATARRAAVSPRSATPSATGPTNGAKDRRALIAEQFDAVTGRV